MHLNLLFATCLITATLHAQEPPADPYREAKSAPAASVSALQSVISVCYEDFSLPLAAAAKLQREQLGDSELYARILAAVEKQTASQESLVLLRGKSGQKSISEAISEQIYPTAYEPAKIPNAVGVAISPSQEKDAEAPFPEGTKPNDAPHAAALGGLRIPATGTSYETRNVGVVFEMETTLSEDGKVVDLKSLPEHIDMVGRAAWGQEISTTEMPIFETRRINSAAIVPINQPFFLGTMNRPPASKIDPDSANRVWFAFVTVTLAKP